MRRYLTSALAGLVLLIAGCGGSEARAQCEQQATDMGYGTAQSDGDRREAWEDEVEICEDTFEELTN